jgi:protein kinase-like protein/sulfatase-modifying factor enzyme 1
MRGEVARGGMGAIIRVWDEELRRPLAMKVILGGNGESTAASDTLPIEIVERFLGEAQIGAQLEHPGVVPVHEVGMNDEGQAYFTMRFVEGRDLKAIIDLVHAGEENWTRTRALEVIIKCCDTLAYAHSRNVIHRDLKPANIMVGKFGEVYVMDWGLAKALGDREHRTRGLSGEGHDVSSDDSVGLETPMLTVDGAVLGTPAYMPPEQARGNLEELGSRSDVYSIGAMLYHLLAGHAPYLKPHAEFSAATLLAAVRNAPPEAILTINSAIPPDLAAICEKAMARDPQERYAGPHELGEDLRAYLDNRVVRAHRTGAMARLGKWVRRNRALASSIAMTIVAIFGALIAAAVGYQGVKSESERANRENFNFRQLADLKTLRDLIGEARTLRLGTPKDLTKMESWVQRAEAMGAKREDHEQAFLATRRLGTETPLSGARDTAAEPAAGTSRMSYEFPDPSIAFLCDALEELVTEGQNLADRDLRRIRARLPLARESLANAQWVAIREEFPEILEPDPGLIPLGRNAQGLWEFWHHDSGARPQALKDLSVSDAWPVGKWARGSGASDAVYRAAASRWLVDDSIGLIFILVPAGPAAPGGDDVVPATFVSKYEMTRAQWERLTGRDPAYYKRGGLNAPAEQVSWFDCAAALPRWGMEIPDESLWQRTARGGAKTRWWTGDEPKALSSGGPIGTKHETHPVGRYRANPYGFHDTIGNVWEWCRSARDSSSPDRVRRGGSFVNDHTNAGHSARGANVPGYRRGDVGIRPIRRISSRGQ